MIFVSVYKISDKRICHVCIESILLTKKDKIEFKNSFFEL